LNTLTQRALRFSVAGAIMVVGTAAMGQRLASIIDLGPGKALGVNSYGEVAGYTVQNGKHYGFIHRDSEMQVLGEPSEFHQIIAGGPSGTRLAVGTISAMVNDPLFGTHSDQAVLAILNPDNTYTKLNLGVDANFAPSMAFSNILNARDNFYGSPIADISGPVPTYSGATHAYGIVRVAEDVPGVDGANQPISFDIYYVVGDYEFDTGVTHAVVWRVVLQSDRYHDLSNFSATTYDLHTPDAEVPNSGGIHSMAPGSSAARAITKFSVKYRGQTTSTCVIGGTLAGSGARWMLSADEAPAVYYANPIQSLWTNGVCQGLYYRLDKDRPDGTVIGYYAGGTGSNALFMTAGSPSSAVGAGVLNGVGLTGIDRGDVWAVGTFDIASVSQAVLFQPTLADPTPLSSFVVGDASWVSLDEAWAISGKTIVGAGTAAGGGDPHAFKLVLR
jgi:hypothetical protein